MLNIEARQHLARIIQTAYGSSRPPELKARCSPPLSDDLFGPLIANPTLAGLKDAWRNLTEAVVDKRAGHPNLSPRTRAVMCVASGIAAIAATQIGAHPEHRPEKIRSQLLFDILAAQWGIVVALSILGSGPPPPQVRPPGMTKEQWAQHLIGDPVTPSQPQTNGYRDGPIGGGSGATTPNDPDINN